MSDQHRAAFLAQLEHMQIRDRCGRLPDALLREGGGGGVARRARFALHAPPCVAVGPVIARTRRLKNLLSALALVLRGILNACAVPAAAMRTFLTPSTPPCGTRQTH